MEDLLEERAGADLNVSLALQPLISTCNQDYPLYPMISEWPCVALWAHSPCILFVLSLNQQHKFWRQLEQSEALLRICRGKRDWRKPRVLRRHCGAVRLQRNPKLFSNLLHPSSFNTLPGVGDRCPISVLCYTETAVRRVWIWTRLDATSYRTRKIYSETSSGKQQISVSESLPSVYHSNLCILNPASQNLCGHVDSAQKQEHQGGFSLFVQGNMCGTFSGLSLFAQKCTSCIRKWSMPLSWSLHVYSIFNAPIFLKCSWYRDLSRYNHHPNWAVINHW